MDLESEQLSLFSEWQPERPEAAVRPRSGDIGSYGLRPYQIEAVEAILSDFEEYRSTLLVMATGTGKTQTFVVAADQYQQQGGGRTLVLAHRRELIDQAEKRFQQLTGLSTGIEMAERTVLGQPLPDVVFASVQTLQSRIHAFDPGDFGLIVADECFPAGTLIDGRPIETLKSGDLVWSFNHATGQEEQKPIRAVLRTPPSQLVTVRLSDGFALTCTANHPIWSDSCQQYIPAIALDRYDMVRTSPGVPPSLQNRRWQRSLESGDRNRWTQPSFLQGSTSGREKRQMAAGAWVDCVEVHKSGDRPAADTLSRDHCLYNLSVEDNENYFANGVLVHNCHHALAESYQLPIQYFRDAKLLGVTATPDRMDKQNLGDVFEHVAYVYDLRQAVEEQYLVPILQQQITVDGMDFSKVRTTAGDLNEGDLEKILTEEAHLHQVAVPTLELAKDRQTLVFCVTVNHAKLMAEMLNRYRPGVAKALDGKSSTEERTTVLQDFSEGRLQVLCNCQLFTEGVDIPSCSCVAMARPTKSRALYSQAVGRGTRLYPGKENLLILDFVGNSGRHELVSAVDIFGKEKDTEIADEVARLIEGADAAVDILAAHDTASETVAAHRREAEMERQQELLKMQALMASRQHIQVDVRYRGSVADPFSWAGISAQEKWGDFDQGPGADLALFLKKHGLNPANFNAAQGLRMRKAIQNRVVKGLCTYKQTKVLWKYGIDASTWPFQRASAALTAIAESHWRPSPELITSLTAG